MDEWSLPSQIAASSATFGEVDGVLVDSASNSGEKEFVGVDNVIEFNLALLGL